MTWREQIVVRILLLVARMFSDDPQLSDDIKALSNSVQIDGTREREKALAAVGLVED